jgi:hypothetical protein
MPTPNEMPGVSLIDRLQAENRKLRDENADLQKSISKLQLFNKILEREIGELKTPQQNGTTEQVNTTVGNTSAPVPVMRIAFYIIVGLLLLASIYAIASLFTRKSTPQEPVLTSAATTPPVATPTRSSIPAKTLPATQKPSIYHADSTSPRKPVKKVEDNINYDSLINQDFSLGHYKVRSRAYFHNRPDETTRTDLFINHLNNTVLEALDEKSGFVFVIFTNEYGKTSRGWLRKIDLQAVR